jgi:Co/Zn/Cd efflux system component
MTLIEKNKPIFKDFASVVKFALAVNLAMFFVELFFGLIANSLALITDSFDFLGDSINYFVAIYVLKKTAKLQSYSAVLKGIFMLVFGVSISAIAIYKSFHQVLIPQSFLMILVSSIALFVNLFVSIILYNFRAGTSNQKSVWLCSRNDVINNFMTIIAGICVSFFASKWPDLIAAAILAILAISSSFAIFKTAFNELKNDKNN